MFHVQHAQVSVHVMDAEIACNGFGKFHATHLGKISCHGFGKFRMIGVFRLRGFSCYMDGNFHVTDLGNGFFVFYI